MYSTERLAPSDVVGGAKSLAKLQHQHTQVPRLMRFMARESAPTKDDRFPMRLPDQRMSQAVNSECEPDLRH
jgi:hypothetical protein